MPSPAFPACSHRALLIWRRRELRLIHCYRQRAPLRGKLAWAMIRQVEILSETGKRKWADLLVGTLSNPQPVTGEGLTGVEPGRERKP